MRLRNHHPVAIHKESSRGDEGAGIESSLHSIIHDERRDRYDIIEILRHVGDHVVRRFVGQRAHRLVRPQVCREAMSVRVHV